MLVRRGGEEGMRFECRLEGATYCAPGDVPMEVALEGGAAVVLSLGARPPSQPGRHRGGVVPIGRAATVRGRGNKQRGLVHSGRHPPGTARPRQEEATPEGKLTRGHAWRRPLARHPLPRAPRLLCTSG